MNNVDEEVSSNPNYDALLDKVKEQDEKIAKLESTVKEVTEFNRALLRSKDVKLTTEDDEEVIAKKYLNKYLEEK